MNRILNIFVLTALILSIAGGLSRPCAGVTFTVTADKTRVAAGEQIIITAQALSTTDLKNISPPALPPSEYFAVLRTSQNSSQSSSIQIINGRMQQEKEITYFFYYFLAARKIGTFTFPALELNADGQTYQSAPFSITVTSQPVVNPDMRAVLRLSKTTLYVGEQAILTFEAAQKPNAPVTPTNEGFGAAIASIDEAARSNFSVSHLFADRIGKNQKSIGGETYVAFEVPFSIVPIKSGTFRLGPIPFEYHGLERSNRRDPFDAFFGGGIFGGGVQHIPKTMLTNTLTIKVIDLPPPPPDFTGAVGSFTLSASIDPAQVPAGDAATLNITLRGSSRPGSMGDVKLPDIDRYFEVFSPEKATSVDTTAQGFRTRRAYKYLVIPREEGQQEIGPIRFVFFDPSSGTYRTTESEPLRITVTKGKKVPRQQARYLSQEEIREVGADIRFIKTPTHLKAQSRFPHRNPVFFILYPLPFLFALFAVLYRMQAQQRERDAARALRNKAYRTATKRLKDLSKRASALSAVDSASRVSDIVIRYISHRFGFAAAGKTMDQLREEFASRSADAETARRLVDFLERLDSVRFSGTDAQTSSPGAQIAAAVSVVTNLEKTRTEKRS